MNWIHVLMVAGICYVLLCLLFYFLQDFFFFRPEILPKTFQYRYAFPFEEVHFEMEDDGYINGLHFKVPNAKGVIFYLKGNSKSVKGWGKFAKDFVSKGYDFFIVDYRGFGKSSGRRTETMLYNDAQHIYKWLQGKYRQEEIVLYGRSWGSGIATRLASWNNPKMLILDSPYFSFFYNIKRFAFFLPLNWLLKYKIRTDRFIKKVTCPIFIFHGSKDRLIPFRQSEMLQKAASGFLEIFKIEDAGHNNLPDFPEYHEYLYDVLNDDTFAAKLEGKLPLVA